jgi:hypothetical protein
MPFDDEDQPESLSSHKSIERADHGKKERAEKRQQKKDLLHLKQKVALQQMRKDTERKEGKPAEGFATKTREEEIKQAKLTAHKEETPEDLINDAKRTEREQDQKKYEQEKNPAA